MLKHSTSLGPARPVARRLRSLAKPDERLANPAAIQQAEKSAVRGERFLQIAGKRGKSQGTQLHKPR